LDKYIELLLDSKSEEETVFMYLNSQNNGDPYDLTVVSYTKREEKRYYTLSGKGLTLYEADVPVEFISLGQWLIERDSYNHIKELSFFKQFKKWKFMRMWKKTIKHNNRMKAKNSLEEKLFMLQTHFQDHLAIHRRLMIEMQHIKFVDICRGDVKRIDDFAHSQSEKRNHAEKQIKAQSVKAHENINKCTQKVLSELRNRIVSEITLDEERKRNNPIQSSNAATMKRKETTDAFDKLGFPAGMTYGHRSSLRKECSRFLRFAYLVDFLTLESLAAIYTNSVSEMLTRLGELDDHGTEKLDEVMVMDFDDSQGNGQAQRGYEPLFYLEVTLNDAKPIPPSEIVDKPINDFVPEPRGNSQEHEFDLFAHLEYEEEREEGEEAPEEEGEPEQTEPIQLYAQTLPEVHNFWIALLPDKDDFQNRIIDDFERGLEKI
jgi:dynein heavy chain, axonemal